jgi:hypothetical protein
MKKIEVKYNRTKNGNRWVSFFDILGFKRMCQTRDPRDIFADIAGCLEALKERHKKQWADWSKFEFVHFSDSFIIFSPPMDPPESNTTTFTGIEQVSRLFAEILIQKQIPVRGAMSCDEFYTDEIENIFFGKALGEAYEVAESCNWLGFVLCPSATRRMEVELGPEDGKVCPIEKSKRFAGLYKHYPIPKRKARKCDAGVEHGTACLFAAREKLLPSLRKMEEMAEKPEQKMKYKNTIKFLQNPTSAC